ncbi:MAG: helix-turn-helix transcriptional regulator [Clostridia bacterium]|nr:helix-turn-helix transcriptional regulator [Clostridia bacterium]
MKKKKLFVYRDDSLYLHHTLTLQPATDDFSFKSHSHNMVEVYYFLRGNARFVVEGNIFPLERGNILVMASGQTHHLLLEPSAAYERMALLIDTSAVPPEFEALSEQVYEGRNLFELTKAEQTWFEESFQLVTKVTEDMQKNLIFSFSVMIFSLLSTKLIRTAESHIEDDIIKKTINYINKNLSKELSLEIIANALYCSKASLNRNFREIMGCTVWEYVIRRRIYSARQRLFLGDNVTEAYEKSGFGDYSSFFRAYKKTVGVSPSEDLKKRQS